MKKYKIISVLCLCAVLSIGLTACDNSNKNSKVNQEVPTYSNLASEDSVGEVKPLLEAHLNKDSVQEYLKQVKVEDLDEFINKEKPLIIDLRGNLAYRNSHVKGSMNILESIFLDVIDNAIVFDKDKVVLLICPTGNKSDKLSMLLNKKLMNVYSLEGGMVELVNNEYPLERISNHE